MSSVEELRARIAKLSIEVDLQKEVLKNLEKDKSLAQRQLNAFLDPVARLPLEISSDIFLQSLPPHRSEPGARKVPMLLLNVSNTWTDIALSTPALWTSMHIVFPCAKGFEECVKSWIPRARNQPLSISLRGPADPGDFDSAVRTIIWQHSRQLQRLELCYEDDEEEGTHYVEVDFFGYGVTTPGPLPLLETLTIRSSTEIEWGAFPGRQILELLRSAPNLIECVFDRLMPMKDVYPENSTNLVHPNLRRLMFGKRGKIPNGDDNILPCLSLPALETLSVPLGEISSANFLSFLKRSSPTALRELIIGRAARLVGTELVECLLLIPSLARLEMWWPRSELFIDLLAALAESSSLLSGLDSLAIRIYPSAVDDFSACWTALLHALSSRRAHVRHVQIEVFQDEFNREVAFKPAEDILSALKELTAEGMQLYIGLKGGKSNFI
ncbi:hypothetical protein DFH06DRAFT_1301961 [Mycena polygramma]|nr:hypothetical protein DFH06DRAFT_1301961 [Mycena polygramma]